MLNSFVGYENMVMLLAPQDITNAETVSSYMDLKYAHQAAFLVVFGAITSATAADSILVTVEAASVETGTEVAVDFNYRISGALGTNTWGAVTAATSAGFSILNAVDNVMVWIELDPGILVADSAIVDARYARVNLSSPADMTACLVAVIGITEPRYVQTTHLSATGAASA